MKNIRHSPVLTFVEQFIALFDFLLPVKLKDELDGHRYQD
jgi:hypothetical protein